MLVKLDACCLKLGAPSVIKKPPVRRLRHVPWSSLFLVKDLDSIGGLLHRRSTLDLGSVIIMAHDPGAVVKRVRI